MLLALSSQRNQLRSTEGKEMGILSSNPIHKCFNIFFDLVIYYLCGLGGHTHGVGDVPENDLFALQQVFWSTLFYRDDDNFIGLVNHGRGQLAAIIF